jgi:trimeric autotransporter adhesin
MKTNFINKIFALSFAFLGTTTALSAQAWVDVAGGYSVDGTIRALANSGGTLYVGGSFLTANGASAGHFVTYNGTAMTTPQSSTLTGNGINAFFSGTNSNLGYTGFFALGNYSTGTATQVNATKWSGLQWGDAAFSSFATPATTNAMGSVITATNKIVTMVGGAFNTATLKYIAKRNAANTAWEAAGTGFDGEVYAIKNFGLDIYAAGNFTKSGTTQLNRIAKWDNVNSKWLPLGTGTVTTLGFNGIVRCLEVYNGELYAGGDFTTAGGVAAKCLAKWDAVNSKWVAVPNGAFTGTSVRSFANGQSGMMIVGNFTKVGTVVTKNAVFLKTTAGVNTFTSYAAGITGVINTVIFYTNNWYCGQEVAAGVKNYLKRWNPTAPVATETLFGESHEFINFKTIPNPASDICNILTETNLESVEVFTMTGSLMLSQNGIRNLNYSIDTQNLTNGIYIIKIKTTDGKLGSRKMIVQH